MTSPIVAFGPFFAASTRKYLRTDSRTSACSKTTGSLCVMVDIVGMN